MNDIVFFIDTFGLIHRVVEKFIEAFVNENNAQLVLKFHVGRGKKVFLQVFRKIWIRYLRFVD